MLNLEIFMTIFQQLINAAQFQITGGSVYQWNSFGSHARFLDFNSPVFNVDFSIIFDSITQEVYQSYLYINDCAYRWTNPTFLQGFKQESFDRDIDPRIASEDIHFSDCVLVEDFISKVKEGFSTGKCDTSILISLNLTPEQEHIFSQLPEGTDFDSFILKALEEKIAVVTKKHKDNWDVVFSALNESDINASINDDTAPISEDNIQEVYNWINSLNYQHVDIFYSDKETSTGIISILTVYQDHAPDIHFEYKYNK